MKKKRKRHFQEHWKSEFPWLATWIWRKNVLLVLLYCRENEAFADKSSPLFAGCGSEGNYRRDPLVNHNTSKCHLACAKAWQKHNQHEYQPPKKKQTSPQSSYEPCLFCGQGRARFQKIRQLLWSSRKEWCKDGEYVKERQTSLRVVKVPNQVQEQLWWGEKDPLEWKKQHPGSFTERCWPQFRSLWAFFKIFDWYR